MKSNNIGSNGHLPRLLRPQKSLVFMNMTLFLDWHTHCINQSKTPLGEHPMRRGCVPNAG